MPKPIPQEGIVGAVALREAELDYRTVIDMVRGAIDKKISAAATPGSDHRWFDMEAVYPDRAVICLDGRHFSYPYTINADNQVELGDAQEVVETYVPIREAASQFLEAVNEEGTVWEVTIIQSGASLNHFYYPDAVLREAAGLFEGARVFVKQDIEHIKGAGKDVRNIVGWISDVHFVEGASPDTGRLAGKLNMSVAEERLRTLMVDAFKRGKKDLAGLSIDADGSAKAVMREGKRVREAKSITKVNSVDLIVEPGAGGGFVRMLEAFNPEQEKDMPLRQKMLDEIKSKSPAAHAKLGVDATDEEITAAYREAVATPAKSGGLDGGVEERIRMVEARAHARAEIGACNLPQAAKDKLLADFAGRARFVEADVSSAISGEREYLAKFAESGRVDLNFDNAPRVEDRNIKMGEMLDAFFDPAHKGHKAVGSFRECYIEFTGDRHVTGQLRDCDRAKLRESAGARFAEALDTTSWADALGDSITRRMQAVYEGQTDLQAWRKVATVGRANDFRSQERVRIGGYGNLPAVLQGADYTALTSPGDDKASFAVSKRGGLETVTLEMIKNDDVNAIRRVPVELALSAGNTLYEFVFDFFRTNPTIYDTKALYHVDHGNLFTAALDATAFAAHRLAMVKQVRAGSAKRLGTTPAFVLVPFELEETAYNLFQRNTNLDQTFVQSQKPQVIVPAYWTDANDWCTVADPMKLPVLEVDFLDGQEQPELFVQDQPNVGSLFTADKITYKIRHIYGGVVLVDGEKGTTKAVVV